MVIIGVGGDEDIKFLNVVVSEVIYDRSRRWFITCVYQDCLIGGIGYEDSITLTNIYEVDLELLSEEG